MIVRYDPIFLKKLKNADVRIRKSFKKQLEGFIKDPNSPQLHNHSLRNQWKGHRSINVTNDWRAVYTEKIEGVNKIAYFVAIGTHKELYK